MKVRQALALMVAGGMLPLASLAYGPGEKGPYETRTAVDKMPPWRHSLPFSIGQVLEHFNQAFGKQAFKVDETSFVYTDRENLDEVVIIRVSDLGGSVGVVLLATGDYGLNYIREFFEAPFFSAPEVQQLYILLDGGSGIRSAILERFTVQMRISETGKWILVAVEFWPSEIYRPQLTMVMSGREGLIARRQIDGKGRAITGEQTPCLTAKVLPNIFSSALTNPSF